ncbi:unnamed protein product [Linum tenue]|uniref:Uncharacterized protein n=1 Tax=Linum tenue TaxID=586396 RepID=A0AAV0HXN6_9ROSI|nr:unnamed protein product [Linum tenue]
MKPPPSPPPRLLLLLLLLLTTVFSQPEPRDDLRLPTNEWKGEWELFTDNSGVSAMHAIVIPNVNKVLMYDATIWRISRIELPKGRCRVLNATTGEEDCFAHSVLMDIDTAHLTPLQLHTDTWCSSGGLTFHGNLISTGGFQGGANTVRYLKIYNTSTWREFPSALSSPRWYSTQAQLADGRIIVIGGRSTPTYEYIPPEGKSNAKPFFFDFLQQTTDPEENNLYPFVFLSPDSNVFVFANNRSVLLNPDTNTVVKEFPVLPGGHRNYPASGMAVLLPLEVLSPEADAVVEAEVLVCGGSAHIDSYTLGLKNVFYEALRDCGRLQITKPRPSWRREVMPSARVMAVVLPDNRVLVAGSNTNNGYIYHNTTFPTELRVEKFSPPYFSPSRAHKKPNIINGGCPKTVSYGQDLTVKVNLNVKRIFLTNFMVTMYVPAFTTHGVAMNQRLVKLLLKDAVKVGEGRYDVSCVAPPNSAVAPEGYFMLSVVHRRIPSEAVWVQLK